MIPPPSHRWPVRISRSLLGLGVGLSFPAVVLADQTVSGTLAGPQLWARGEVITVPATVTITGALTIQRGVTVRVAPEQGVRIGSGGSVWTEGTAAEPIRVFGEGGRMGGWIHLSGSQPSQLEHVWISHARFGFRGLGAGDVVLRHCRIEDIRGTDGSPGQDGPTPAAGQPGQDGTPGGLGQDAWGILWNSSRNLTLDQCQVQGVRGGNGGRGGNGSAAGAAGPQQSGLAGGRGAPGGDAGLAYGIYVFSSDGFRMTNSQVFSVMSGTGGKGGSGGAGSAAGSVAEGANGLAGGAGGEGGNGGQGPLSIGIALESLTTTSLIQDVMVTDITTSDETEVGSPGGIGGTGGAGSPGGAGTLAVNGGRGGAGGAGGAAGRGGKAGEATGIKLDTQGALVDRVTVREVICHRSAAGGNGGRGGSGGSGGAGLATTPQAAAGGAGGAGGRGGSGGPAGNFARAIGIQGTGSLTNVVVAGIRLPYQGAEVGQAGAGGDGGAAGAPGGTDAAPSAGGAGGAAGSTAFGTSGGQATGMNLTNSTVIHATVRALVGGRASDPGPGAPGGRGGNGTTTSLNGTDGQASLPQQRGQPALQAAMVGDFQCVFSHVTASSPSPATNSYGFWGGSLQRCHVHGFAVDAFQTSGESPTGGFPSFVGTKDHRLQSQSPLINAGTTTSVRQDIRQEPRDSLPDIGAYEFLSSPQTRLTEVAYDLLPRDQTPNRGPIGATSSVRFLVDFGGQTVTGLRANSMQIFPVGAVRSITIRPQGRQYVVDLSGIPNPSSGFVSILLRKGAAVNMDGNPSLAASGAAIILALSGGGNVASIASPGVTVFPLAADRVATVTLHRVTSPGILMVAPVRPADRPRFFRHLQALEEETLLIRAEGLGEWEADLEWALNPDQTKPETPPSKVWAFQDGTEPMATYDVQRHGSTISVRGLSQSGTLHLGQPEAVPVNLKAFAVE